MNSRISALRIKLFCSWPSVLHIISVSDTFHSKFPLFLATYSVDVATDKCVLILWLWKDLSLRYLKCCVITDVYLSCVCISCRNTFSEDMRIPLEKLECVEGCGHLLHHKFTFLISLL